MAKLGTMRSRPSMAAWTGSGGQEIRRTGGQENRRSVGQKVRRSGDQEVLASEFLVRGKKKFGVNFGL